MGGVVELYESGTFEKALGEAIHPGGLSLTKRMAEVLEVDKSHKILDIACGKGTTAAFLSQEYGCCVVGIDPSYKLISMAQGEATLITGDAERLPFKDFSFDIIVSECSFSLLDKKDAAIREMKRILKAGGKLAITDFFLRGEFSKEYRTQAAFATCIAGAMKLDEYVRLFEEAGFEDPYIEDHSIELKKVTGQIFSAYGTMQNFLANLGDSSIEDWMGMFREGKPGYALIVVTKPLG